MDILLLQINNRKDQIKEYIRFQKIAGTVSGDLFIS
jgi:hypothetical protein